MDQFIKTNLYLNVGNPIYNNVHKSIKFNVVDNIFYEIYRKLITNNDIHDKDFELI